MLTIITKNILRSINNSNGAFPLPSVANLRGKRGSFINISSSSGSFVCYSKMAKPKVYVTRTITQEAMDVLEESCEVFTWTGQGPAPRNELEKHITDAAGLFCMLSDKIDKELVDKAKKLKVVGTMSVGYDHLSIDALRHRNIRIGYTPDVLTDSSAELTVALLLATSRRVIESSEEARTGGWKAWAPFWMCGPGLGGSTIGIVGFGRIGQEVAKRLKPFNVKKILFHNRSEKWQEAEAIGATKVDFDTLLKQSDFVIVTTALTPETTGIFDEAAFNRMKPTAVFINTSRGPVVQQEALIKALQNKTIWAAGLDVMTPEPLPLDNPLFKLKNCTILPHIGSACIETRNQMAVMTAQNIVNGLKGEKMPAELTT